MFPSINPLCALAFAVVFLVSACSDLKNPDDRGSDLGLGDSGPGSFTDGDSAGDRNAVVEVAVGERHICVILEHGNVRCWGQGKFGALGYGNQNDIGRDQTPASAGDVQLGGKAVHIAVGIEHSCALLEGGRVRCWGHSSPLGYGNTEDIGDDELPLTAGDVDVGGAVTQIAAAGDFTCALLDGGTVRCWGAGWLGYPNHGPVGDDETPASVGDVNVGGTVVQIAPAFDHVCALLQTGTVRCWGLGVGGVLGYGNEQTIGDDEVPAQAGDVDVGGPVASISAGLFCTCAVLVDGRLRCWGQNGEGQLGYGHTNDIGLTGTPAQAGDVPVGASVQQVSIAPDGQNAHTCVRLDNGNVRCWGWNAYGELGYGHTSDVGDDETPASVGDVDIGGTVTQVSAGGTRTCAVLVGGHVRCWGSGRLGYPGVASIGDDETPASAGDVPVN